MKLGWNVIQSHPIVPGVIVHDACSLYAGAMIAMESSYILLYNDTYIHNNSAVTHGGEKNMMLGYVAPTFHLMALGTYNFLRDMRVTTTVEITVCCSSIRLLFPGG